MSTSPDAPTYQINERESGRFTALLLGDDETMIPGSTLSTLVLTLYVVKSDGTDQILNSRNRQNVLGVNDVVLYDTEQTDPDGNPYNLLWNIRPLDTVIVEERLNWERHIALFEWTTPAGVSGNTEVVLNVRNLRRVS